jgi:hypothetical protein
VTASSGAPISVVVVTTIRRRDRELTRVPLRVDR